MPFWMASSSGRVVPVRVSRPLPDGGIRWRVVLTITFGIAVTWVPAIIFYPSGDFHYFLAPWWAHIIATGRLHALSAPFGNYSPPYLYLLSAATLLDGLVPALIAVKLLSTLGAAWLAFAVARLARTAGARRPAEVALWSMLTPSVYLNVPIIAQCDVFWCAPALLAVAASVRRDMLTMALWAGVSFAFKAQAVFLAPFVVAMLLRTRAPWHIWLSPVAVYAVAMLPAWVMGWPASDLLTVYWRQVTWSPEEGWIFVSNAANVWAALWYAAPSFATSNWRFVGVPAAIFATVAYVAVFARRRLGNAQLVAAAALSAAMVPSLLPSMHERYFILAEMLAFVYAFTAPTRPAIAIAVLFQLETALTIGGYLNGHGELATLGCTFALIAIALLLVETRDEKRATTRPARAL